MAEVTLSEERKGQIAYRLFLEYLKRRGLPSLADNELKRSIVNEARSVGAEPRELAEFLRIAFKDLFRHVDAHLALIKAVER